MGVFMLIFSTLFIFCGDILGFVPCRPFPLTIERLLPQNYGIAIAFQNPSLQLSRHETDDLPGEVKSDEKASETSEVQNKNRALPSAASKANEATNKASKENLGKEGISRSDEIDDIVSGAVSASIPVMISMETKRVLIEELGYRRRDVDRMRFELAGPIIEKRVRCPPEGMPESWMMDEQDIMAQRLERESKYPLKFPLLGISLVLFGKGFGDALITLIKVSINFPGASFTEQFMGFPVLAIDALCIILGSALGYWTWNAMGGKK